MSRKGLFYLSRIIKIQIDKTDIIETLQNPVPIKVGDFFWTFTDFQIFHNASEPYYYAKMTKFISQGEVAQLDREKNTTSYSITPDMIEASSPFVFIPEYSGITYLHIWNKIEEDTFRNRFSLLVSEKHQGFFVDCKLEPISDMTTFLNKMTSLDTVTRIYAKVNPPNPSFGHLWKDLNEYMKKRKTDEVIIEERSSTQIQTNLKTLVKTIQENFTADNSIPDIGDAAILMAADGYGNGKIEGFVQGHVSIINTKDNAIVLKLPIDIQPDALYEVAQSKLIDIAMQRHMEH